MARQYKFSTAVNKVRKNNNDSGISSFDEAVETIRANRQNTNYLTEIDRENRHKAFEESQRQARQRAIELAKTSTSSSSNANAGDNRTTAFSTLKNNLREHPGDVLKVAAGAAITNELNNTTFGKAITTAATGQKIQNRVSNYLTTGQQGETTEELLAAAEERTNAYDNNVKNLFKELKQAKADFATQYDSQGFAYEEEAYANRIKDIENQLRDAGLSDEDIEQYQKDADRIANAKKEKTRKEKIANSLNEGGVGKNVAYAAGDILSSTVAGIPAVINAVGAKIKGEDVDTNSGAWTLSNINRDIEEVQNDIIVKATDKAVGKEGSFAGSAAGYGYGVAMSTAKSVTSMAIGGKIAGAIGAEAGLSTEATTKLANAFTLPGFGATAAAEAIRDGQERGLNSNQILATAVSAGFFEMFFERFSLDHAWDIVKNNSPKVAKNMLLNWFMQGAIESSEEGATDIANWLADYLINGNLSEYETVLNETGSNKDTVLHFAKQLGLDMLAGYLSGEAGGAIYYGANTHYQTKGGRQIINNKELSQQIVNDISTEKTDYATEDEYNEAQNARQTILNASEKVDKGQKISGKEAREVYEKAAKALESLNARKNVEAVKAEEDITDASTEEEQVEYKAPAKTNEQIIEDIEFASTPYQLAQAIDQVTEETDEIKELIEYKKQELEMYNFNSSDVDNAVTEKKALEMGQRGEEVTEEQLNAIPEADRQKILEANNQAFNKSVLAEHPNAVVDKTTGKYFVPAEVKVEGADVVIVDSEGNAHTDYENPKINQAMSVVTKTSKDARGHITDQSIYQSTPQQAAYAVELALKSPEATSALIKTAVEAIYDSASVGHTSFDEFEKNSKGLFTKVDKTAAKFLYNAVAENARKSDARKTENTAGKKTSDKAVSDTLREALPEETTALLEALSEKIGYNFVASTNKNARGSINPGTRQISIGTNSVDEVWSIVAHEAIGEYLQAHGNEADVLAIQDDMFKYLEGKLGSDAFNDLINQYQSVYRTGAKTGSVDYGKSRRAAANEMFNDTIFALLSSEEGIKDYVSWLNEGHEKSFFEKVKDFFSKLVQSIRDYIDNGSFNPAERAALEMDYDQAKAMRDRIFKAMDAATANVDAGVTDNKEADNRNSKRLNSGLYLSDNDIAEYLYIGNQSHKQKTKNFKSGKQIILHNEFELIEFVEEAIKGNRKDTVAYGRLSDVLASKIINAAQQRNINVKIDNYFVALVGNDIKHSFELHKEAKQEGDFPLSKDELLYAIKNINFAQVDFVEETSKHTQKVYLSFDMGNGIIEMIEIISTGNGSLNFKNAWKQSYEKHEKYKSTKDVARGRTSMIARTLDAFPNSSVSREEQKTTDKFSKNNEKIVNNADERNSIKVDSDGNSLSEGQQEYFADSKIRDDQGRLKVMYHGTQQYGFTVFDKKKAKGSGYYGRGFYFSSEPSHAGQYGEQYKVYLNITNPMQSGDHNITKDQLRAFVESVAEDEDYGIDNYGYDATVDSVTDDIWSKKDDFAMLQDINAACVGDFVAAVKLFNEINGTDYDGIVVPTETVAFESNQIKNVDNLNPTNDEDIRYSKKIGDIEQAAVEHFGTTDSFRVAGYMLTDGTLLDFSGAHWLEGESPEYIAKWKSQNDIRQVDHEDIYEVMEASGDNRKQFMDRGNIRLNPEAPGFNLSTKTEPTAAQYRELKEFIREVKNNPYYDASRFYVDIEDTHPNKISYANNLNEDRIINDIKKFYETGELPQESSLNDFRYSIKVDWDNHNIYKLPDRTYEDDIFFLGTDEEIEAAEKQDITAKAYVANIIHSKDFAGLMFKDSVGIDRLLTRSTRKEWDWQLSESRDGEPIGHENYKEENDDITSYDTWPDKTMAALYNEIINELPKSDARIYVIREGIAEDARNSIKVYGEASPYADSINETKVISTMLGSMNNSLSQVDAFNVSNEAYMQIEKSILKKYNAQLEEGELAANVSFAFAYMQQNKLETNYEKMMNYLLNIGDEVIKNSNLKDPESEQLYNSAKDVVKKYTFKLSEADREEIKTAFGGNWKTAFGELQKAGIKLNNDKGVDIDTVFSQLQSEFLQSAGINLEKYDKPSEQILGLLDAMHALEPTAYLWDGANSMDKALTVVADIINDYYSIATGQLASNVVKGTKKGKETVAAAINKEKDKLNQKFREYKANKTDEFNQIVAEKNRIIQEQQNQIKQQNEQMKKWNAELSDKDKQIQQAKVLTEKQMKQTAKLQAREAVESYRQREERARQIENIKKTGIRLIKWLNNPTDNQHVPAFLQKPLGEFLAAIDFLPKNAKADSKNTLTWQQRMQSLRDTLVKIKDAEAEADGSVEAYFAENMIAKELISMMDDFLGKETWDEFTQSYIVTKRSASKVSLLDAKDLATLNKIMSALSASINNMNKTYANSVFKEVSKLAKESVKEIDALPAKKARTKAGGTLEKLLRYDELEPITYFENLGNGAKSVFDELRQGFNVKTRHVREADEYMSKVKEDLGLTDIKMSDWKNQTKVFNLSEGKVELTVTQIMSLYEILNRKQGKPHVAIGGIKAGDVYARDENGKFIKKNKHQAKAVHILSSEAQAIINSLTDEQRALADAMQKFMANECSSWGNRVTEKMFGYKKFEEKDYFPLKTDSNTRATTASSDNNVSYYSIKNSSFTKPITPMANNAVVIDDIFDVFTDHVVKMADYDAYVMPIADAMRWFNYSEKTINAVAPDELNEAGQRVDYIGNMQESIDRAMGSEGLQYFRQFIKDINGDYAGRGGVPDALNSLMGMYKAAAVGANIRVVIQQPTAIIRAADVIETEYLVKAYAGDVATLGVRAMKYAKKAQANSEIAYWKAQGYYETYLGQSFKEIITGDKRLRDWLTDVAGWAAGKADDLSWGIMYHAAELKVQKTMPQLKVDSAEYTKEVVKIFEDIVDHTQVVDTIFHKSQYMRNQGLGYKITSAFMAEPTKTYNMIYRAYYDSIYLKKGKKYALKKLSKVALIFVIEQLVNAIRTALWDSLRDDEKESYLAGLRSAFLENSVDNLLLLNLVPISKDIVSFFHGYDATSYIYDGLENLINTILADKKYVMNYIHEEKQSKTLYGISYQNVKALSQLSGIPFANVMRDVTAIYNAVNDLWGGDDLYKTESTKAKAEKNEQKKLFSEAYEKNDLTSAKTAMQDIYNKQIEAGKDESGAWSAVRTILKEEYLSQIAQHPEDRAAINKKYATLVSNTKHKVSGVYKNYTVDQAKEQYIDKWYESLDK